MPQCTCTRWQLLLLPARDHSQHSLKRRLREPPGGSAMPPTMPVWSSLTSLSTTLSTHSPYESLPMFARFFAPSSTSVDTSARAGRAAASGASDATAAAAAAPADSRARRLLLLLLLLPVLCARGCRGGFWQGCCWCRRSSC
jgi:hypothetical protein